MAEKCSPEKEVLSNFRFARSRVTDRQVDELLGIIKGVLADGEVSQTEAEFVLSWLHTNRECCERWPASDLLVKLEGFLADGVLDDVEESELLAVFLSLTGNPDFVPIDGSSDMSAAIPYDNPLPRVIKFPGKSFCLTGKFAWEFGPRSQIEETIRFSGGITQTNVTKDTDFLVIGGGSTRDWIHSTYGRKIEKAIELRGKGQALAIVPESEVVRRLFK